MLDTTMLNQCERGNFDEIKKSINSLIDIDEIALRLNTWGYALCDNSDCRDYFIFSDHLLRRFILTGWCPLQKIVTLRISYPYTFGRRTANILIDLSDPSKRVHQIPDRTILAAINANPNNAAAAVHGAQCWLWGVPDHARARSLADGLRRGDVLFVHRFSRGFVNKYSMPRSVIIGAHCQIRADRIVGDSRFYALNPIISDPHADACSKGACHKGWYSIRVTRTTDLNTPWTWIKGS